MDLDQDYMEDALQDDEGEWSPNETPSRTPRFTTDLASSEDDEDEEDIEDDEEEAIYEPDFNGMHNALGRTPGVTDLTSVVEDAGFPSLPWGWDGEGDASIVGRSHHHHHGHHRRGPPTWSHFLGGARDAGMNSQ